MRTLRRSCRRSGGGGGTARAPAGVSALDAAGLSSRRLYDLRHSFASNALAAGISLHELSRYRGASVRVLEMQTRHGPLLFGRLVGAGFSVPTPKTVICRWSVLGSNR
jgi:hypothetical protein